MPGYLSDFQKMFRAERYNTRFPLQKGDFVYTVFFFPAEKFGEGGGGSRSCVYARGGVGRAADGLLKKILSNGGGGGERERRFLGLGEAGGFLFRLKGGWKKTFLRGRSRCFISAFHKTKILRPKTDRNAVEKGKGGRDEFE